MGCPMRESVSFIVSIYEIHGLHLPVSGRPRCWSVDSIATSHRRLTVKNACVGLRIIMHALKDRLRWLINGRSYRLDAKCDLSTYLSLRVYDIKSHLAIDREKRLAARHLFASERKAVEEIDRV